MRDETGMMRRILARLLAWLESAWAQTLAQAPAMRSAAHIPISSYNRRYPGRTPASELRRNLGWVAVMAARPHRDRRA
ncbi:MAG: hypothetical protein CTR53_02190 [Ferrovibrio sp.]|nr:MAG: hypothetical protein CTR53_02190 [Ferrovibrio sp.]